MESGRKKRKFKILVALLVVFSIFGGVFAFATQYDREADARYQAEIDRMIDDAFGEGFSENQRRSLEVLDRIHEMFGKDDYGFVNYPNYYGVESLDSRGNLVIRVVDSDLWRREGEKLKSILTGEINVSIEIVSYSYNELLEIIEFLKFKFLEGENFGIENVASWGIGADNRVSVYLQELSEERIREFKNNVINTPIIIFKEMYGEFSRDTSSMITTWPGSQIVESPIPPTSLGYRARRNGVNGFVTTAHGVSLHGLIQRMPSAAHPAWVDLGDVFGARSLNDVDAAFITTRSNIINSNLNSNNTLVYYPVMFTSIIGSVVEAIGFTSGWRFGAITDVGKMVQFNDPPLPSSYVFDVVITSCVSQGGDSGGIVYSSSNRNIAGIHVGSTKAHPFISIYSTVQNINRKFNLTLY